jgi:hypothetical protein
MSCLVFLPARVYFRAALGTGPAAKQNLPKGARRANPGQWGPTIGAGWFFSSRDLQQEDDNDCDHGEDSDEPEISHHGTSFDTYVDCGFLPREQRVEVKGTRQSTCRMGEGRQKLWHKDKFGKYL